MAKINLNNITNPQSVSVMNANFQKIMVALDEQVLYRDNPDEEPNQMENDIDMNGYRIYNLPAPVADHEPLRLIDGKTIVVEQSQDLIDAANAAIAAAQAATIAANNANEAVSEVVGTADAAFAAASTALSTANTAQAGANDATANINTYKGNVAAPGGSALVGFLQAGAGAVARTTQDKNRDFVSVKDFGAKGDGVTDDTAAFLACRDFMQTNSAYRGGRIYIPKGVYILKQTWAFTQYAAELVHNITLFGDGPQASVLDFTTATVDSDGVSFGKGTHFAIEDLSIAGARRDGISLVAGTVGSSDYSQQCRIKNVRVTLPVRDGIRSLNLFMARFEDIWVLNAGGNGFNFIGFHTSCHMSRSWASSCAGIGWAINGMVYSSFNSCGSDSNLYGYTLSNTRGITFNGCGTEDNQRDGWAVITSDASTTGLTVAVHDVHGLVLNGCYGFLNGVASPSTYANLVGVYTANSREASVTIVGCATEKREVNDPSVITSGASGQINLYEVNCRLDGPVSVSGNVVYSGRPFNFNPTVVGSVSGGAGTYTTRNGRYSITGGILTYTMDVVWTAHTGTGAITITGLPIVATGASMGSAQTTNLDFTTEPSPVIATGSTAISLSENRTGSTPVLTLMKASGRILATGSFPIK